MICKHVNLTTTEVTAGVAFFEQYFEFDCRHVGGRNGDGIAVLCNEDNFVLTLMKGTDKTAYPGNFHVGFYLETPDAVEAKHQQLMSGGANPGKVQHLSRGGNVTTFYVTAPGNIEIEISTPPDEMIK